MNERNKKCIICGMTFYGTFQLNAHYKKHSNNKKILMKSVNCHLCPVSYSNIETIRKHYRAKHTTDELRTICLSCNTEFSTEDQLNEHRKPNGQRCKCTLCRIKLPCLQMHSNHLDAHAKQEFTCDVRPMQLIYLLILFIFRYFRNL